ncbi:ImmA/IrrE family metallo-endopeptidase [Novosphingobium sp. FGD1]|uniref:ImmA/IrrE family metallo-endopeptidase n=1 Tax=Novosphingobium silvae TaxID=2692619 RepID=A0A7X4K8J5_9SPHN|nr:XRE family transcriptional regulator [Novosphingobium silvae]MYM00252.1 ImmA/IrrE family metallo-endopeptidase [Novosphingobium silvae]
MFNAQRLILARRRRKLTARALANAIGASPVTISRLENASNEPGAETVDALARALGFPKEFFFGEELDELPGHAASFRSLSSMTARERDAALSAGAIAYLFHDWVAERFNLPAADVPTMSENASPEEAAQIVRASWGLGQQPISNMVKLLEAKGVRVFSLSEETNSVDAFSCWRGDQPFAFLNTFKSAERSRFDAAHELGHLVMHRHGAPQDSKQAESEADRFASEFLMPADDVRSRIRHVTCVEDLIRLKLRWGVSVAALNYRVNKLGLASEWQNRSLNIEIARRGYRKNEPAGMLREQSSLWPQVFTSLWQERLTRESIATQLHVPTSELDQFLVHLNDVQVAATAETPGLRAVK